jgi:hypothetical protein
VAAAAPAYSRRSAAPQGWNPQPLRESLSAVGKSFMAGLFLRIFVRNGDLRNILRVSTLRIKMRKLGKLAEPIPWFIVQRFGQDRRAVDSTRRSPMRYLR